ncbi:MAG: hypothetical protein CL920_14495 [Deltaproteobacteria bacterium]|nr:hypothetical protein [Deltaproteobacteria bacterium]MBU49893.1 hypothetical protein [Deltaproteobacteria bacterium]|tara:strand:- start:3584 stop:3901 length:318 start_codon:yes stop_codon:yes gene_type:complete
MSRSRKDIIDCVLRLLFCWRRPSKPREKKPEERERDGCCGASLRFSVDWGTQLKKPLTLGGGDKLEKSNTRLWTGQGDFKEVLFDWAGDRLDIECCRPVCPPPLG